MRTRIEEGHRQLKCFWGLTHFPARAFTLVVNPVVFVALAYTLLQLYLRQHGRAELNRRTRPRVRDQLLPSAAVILLYCQQRFAILSPLEYIELLLILAEPARRKILAHTRRLRREPLAALPIPRPPYGAGPPSDWLCLRIPATGGRAGGHPGGSPVLSLPPVASLQRNAHHWCRAKAALASPSACDPYLPSSAWRHYCLNRTPGAVSLDIPIRPELL